jgi:hypothetical protein
VRPCREQPVRNVSKVGKEVSRVAKSST